MEETWEAYCAGSVPVGAVVVDSKGAIIGRGRNHCYDLDASPGQISAHVLAHAEMNALLTIRNMVVNYHTCALYSSLEPCPLCMGALYMSGIRHLLYAARDPMAGSVEVLGKTPYLSRKPIKVTPPEWDDLENILIALNTDFMLRINPQRPQLTIEMYRDVFPQGVRFGEALFESKYFGQIHQSRQPAGVIFEQLRIQFKSFLTLK